MSQANVYATKIEKCRYWLNMSIFSCLYITWLVLKFILLHKYIYNIQRDWFGWNIHIQYKNNCYMQEHKSLTGLIFNVSYPVNLSLAFNINNNELIIGDESYTRLVQRTGYTSMSGLYSMPRSFRTIFIINVKENNSPQLDTSPNPDSATWIRPNQCLLWLFVTVCLPEN